MYGLYHSFREKQIYIPIVSLYNKMCICSLWEKECCALARRLICVFLFIILLVPAAASASDTGWADEFKNQYERNPVPFEIVPWDELPPDFPLLVLDGESWKISPEKKFGLAQLGYNINAQGFTVSVNLPSYEWFERLNDALAASRGDEATFVAYWAQFDADSRYDVSIEGVKIENFYTKLAQRFVASLEEGEFSLLYTAAIPLPAFLGGGEKFKKLAASYKTLAEKLDTGIQPAYIYKKVE